MPFPKPAELKQPGTTLGSTGGPERLVEGQISRQPDTAATVKRMRRNLPWLIGGVVLGLLTSATRIAAGESDRLYWLVLGLLWLVFGYGFARQLLYLKSR